MIEGFFSFRGRITRQSWWLFCWFPCTALGIVAAVIERLSSGPIGYGAATALVGVQLWILLAGSIRRLHDRGQSAWYLLIAFIPIVGGLWWVITCGFLRGQHEQNEHGPVPEQLA